MKILRLVLILISLFFAASPAISQPIKIAPWNIENLRDTNIDHIVLDRNASQWVVEDSFKQLVYSEGESLKKKLSDYCPISIILDPTLVRVDPKMQQLLNKIDFIEKQLEELRQMVKEPE